MKRLSSILSVMMILSVLMALFPSGVALAAKDPGSVVLVIHNNTGGAVNFDLMEPNGGPHHEYKLEKGITKLTLDAGWHSYFAGMPCGDRAGSFNLNVGKELYLTCGKGTETGEGAVIKLYNFARRDADWFCNDIYAFPNITAPETPNQSRSWRLFGWVCQDVAPQVGDLIDLPFPLPPYTIEFLLNGGGACNAPRWGPAYYRVDCY